MTPGFVSLQWTKDRKAPIHASSNAFWIHKPAEFLPAVAVSEARQRPSPEAGRAGEAALARGEKETPGLEVAAIQVSQEGGPELWLIALLTETLHAHTFFHFLVEQ